MTKAIAASSDDNNDLKVLAAIAGSTASAVGAGSIVVGF